MPHSGLLGSSVVVVVVELELVDVVDVELVVVVVVVVVVVDEELVLSAVLVVSVASGSLLVDGPWSSTVVQVCGSQTLQLALESGALEESPLSAELDPAAEPVEVVPAPSSCVVPPPG